MLFVYPFVHTREGYCITPVAVEHVTYLTSNGKLLYSDKVLQIQITRKSEREKNCGQLLKSEKVYTKINTHVKIVQLDYKASTYCAVTNGKQHDKSLY